MLVELQEVVGGGDQPPFRERGRSSSSLELVDAPVVLGLCEHRLDHRLSSSVEPVCILGRERLAHRRVPFALPSRPRGLALASVRRDENLHVLVGHDMVEVISNEQYERLRRCARASRTDSYGLILEGAILAIGEAAIRPGEIFALNHSDIDLTTGLIYIRRQLDLASGVTAWPKDDEPRNITMTPALRSHLEIMPKISQDILFPTPRGCYMRRSTWSAHWHSVRAAAQMPGLEFYELRHRAIQWMIDPPHDGGLGLDIQTAAQPPRRRLPRLQHVLKAR